MSIPVKDCPRHGKQKVYVVCRHLMSLIGDQWTRNQEPIAAILPPREGWNGFIMCAGEHNNPNQILAICERCALEQGLLLPAQLGKAFHLTNAKIGG